MQLLPVADLPHLRSLLSFLCVLLLSAVPFCIELAFRETGREKERERLYGVWRREGEGGEQSREACGGRRPAAESRVLFGRSRGMGGVTCASLCVLRYCGTGFILNGPVAATFCERTLCWRCAAENGVDSSQTSHWNVLEQGEGEGIGAMLVIGVAPCVPR